MEDMGVHQYNIVFHVTTTSSRQCFIDNDNAVSTVLYCSYSHN